jgi:glutaredoxin-like YruB-family protein
MKRVDIYTSESCGYCHAAKDFLRQHNISFVEHDITTDSKAKKELISRGYRSVPLIIVDNIEISGFDKDKLSEVLML